MSHVPTLRMMINPIVLSTAIVRVLLVGATTLLQCYYAATRYSWLLLAAAAIERVNRTPQTPTVGASIAPASHPSALPRGYST